VSAQPVAADRSRPLHVENLHVQLGGSHILQGVTMRVHSGGITAVLGRNGAGKTTTLRAILGLVPSNGSITVLGHDVTGWPTHRIVRLGVGYVPEDRDIFSRLTVGENLRLADTCGASRHDEVYELFPELRRRDRQMAGTLSGGQQQMLAIGRVLLGEQSLLLVDEPTKGLSPLYVGEVVSALERVSARATVVLVEQNVHVVRRLARHVVVLDHGQVVHSGGVADLGDDDLVRRLLGVSGATRRRTTGTVSTVVAES
jgi:branched-chain amino acid transport system ATP-binding protein